MGHNLNNTHLTRIAAAVFLSASAFLTSCGGGSSPAPAVFSVQYTCAADEIPVTDGSVNSCRAMAQLDLDQDGVADGIDFNADGFAEILFKATSTAGVTGLDVNGDGISDYYMYTDGNGGYDLNTREDGKGSRVFLTTTIDGVLLGFDSSGDGVVDDDSLTSMANDVTAPTVVTDLTGGIFGGEQEITITCQDDVACHSIAYTLDGSAPDFAGNGTQILSGVGTVTIGPAEGAYTLRYIVRDANGLTSAIGQSEYFVSASSCPVVPSFDTVAYLEVNQSQNFNLTAENISYLYGTVSDISWTQSIVGSEDDLTSGAGSLSGATVNLTAPAQVTTYKFSVVARADNGCSSAPQTTFVYVMKNTNNAVFVDANTGFDTDAGSRAAPFATLSKAVTTGKDIYVQNAASYIANQTLPANISMYGAFDADWVRHTDTAKTVLNNADTGLHFSDINAASEISGFDIRPAASCSGDCYGVKLSMNTAGSFLIEKNTIQSGTATVAGSSSFAISSEGSGGTVTIQTNSITAGDGASGANGSNGANGPDGGRGGNGSPGSCDLPSGGAGGNYGASAVTSSRGGLGGAGGYLAAGAMGRCGGNGAYCTAGGAAGDPGRTGSTGAAGANGTNGSYTSVRREPSLTLNGFAMAYSVLPNPVWGGFGNGGNGGGGGGGQSDSIFIIPGTGNGGGGGGGGGSRGVAGDNGGVGGNSIAIALGGLHPAVISNNTIQAGNSGAGGSGGLGGLGGAGGSGGGGGGTCTAEVGRGGNGGTGGRGGYSGGGQGGVGGSTYAVLLASDTSTYELSSNIITTGNAGNGGNGATGGVYAGQRSFSGHGGNSIGIAMSTPAPANVLLNSNTQTIGMAGQGGTGGVGDGNVGVRIDQNF